MKQRVERMAQIVRRIISSELLKVLPQAHLTLTQVEISDDLRYATVWLSTFSKELTLTQALEGAESHRRELQTALNNQVQTKFVPQLRFRIDAGKTHADRVDELLDNLSN